jgi:hypothetical protein
MQSLCESTGGGAVYNGMALALSRNDSWPFTPTARSHDRSKHQHADDDQEKDERNEQTRSSLTMDDPALRGANDPARAGWMSQGLRDLKQPGGHDGASPMV